MREIEEGVPSPMNQSTVGQIMPMRKSDNYRYFNASADGNNNSWVDNINVEVEVEVDFVPSVGHSIDSREVGREVGLSMRSPPFKTYPINGVNDAVIRNREDVGKEYSLSVPNIPEILRGTSAYGQSASTGAPRSVSYMTDIVEIDKKNNLPLSHSHNRYIHSSHNRNGNGNHHTDQFEDEDISLFDLAK